MALRADSYGPPSLIASAIPVSWSVTDVLVITEEPCGMRARTASRAASRLATTSTLNPCSSSATTVDAIVSSSGCVVKRSAVPVVVKVVLLGGCRRWRRCLLLETSSKNTQYDLNCQVNLPVRLIASAGEHKPGTDAAGRLAPLAGRRAAGGLAGLQRRHGQAALGTGGSAAARRRTQLP